MNPELRYKSLWLAIGYALIALVIYLSLTSKPVTFDIDIPFQDKFLHGLAYFTLMFWFGQIYHELKPLILWAVAFILMGLGLEYLQSFEAERYTEVADMTANNLGVIIAYLLVKTDMRYLLERVERVFIRTG